MDIKIYDHTVQMNMAYMNMEQINKNGLVMNQYQYQDQYNFNLNKN